MKNWILAGAAAAALVSGNAQAQTARSLADDAAAFGAREAVSAPRLSPDGSSVLYVTPGPGLKGYAVISNLVSGKTSVVTSADGAPETIDWCNYASPSRVVCRVSGGVLQVGEILGFQRLLAMNTDGTDAKLLGQPSSFYDAGYRQFDGAVLDWRGGVDGTVLMVRDYVPEAGRIQSRISRTKSGLGVDLVDTATLRVSQVEPPRDEASGYMSDGRGNIRIMTSVERQSNGSLTGRVKYFYRTKDSREWKSLIDYADFEDQLEPLAVDAEIDSLYALKKKDGRKALYTIKLDGSRAERLVAEHPRVDISGVMRSGDGQRVIGYRYSDEISHRVYFDPEFKALSESLSRALPTKPIVSFVDSTMDGRKLLIFAGSDNDPGRFYLFDRDKKSLNEAMLERPQLEGRTLAQVKSVTIPAPDGAQIPAYLTLPPGRDAKGLPAIVLPHGGPSARDYWGFDWLSQFFAARGYAVLQPQYRGSEGYGDAWLNENGFKNWRTSIGDISASVRWLAAQGIADSNRIAIVGWSYGGYAALQSAATDPSLYKAVAAIAPVTDLQLLKQDAANFSNARLVQRFIGSGPHVSEGSPLKRAAEIRVPVLLVHGDMDSNVRYWHSEKMRDALRGAGKQVEFVGYKGYDHYLQDSTVRAQVLTKVAQLLDRTIGK